MGKAPTIFESAFDTYTVQGSIGNGGCGTVFSVKNSANEELALKCLSPNVTSTKKRKRFKNEIDFCLKQRHPNIIQVIDYGIATWDKVSVPFYVMAQYTSTLAKLIKTSLSAQQVLPLFSNILDGVEAAHKLGVTHRDLKPENILYDESKNLLVIADFGIADFAEQLMATMVETKPGERMANFHYAAPEQCRQGASVDWRADIYALGAILNEMFTQHVPRGQGYSTIGSISQEYRYLDSLVEQMLQTDPNARPQSIEAIKKDLIGHKNEFIRLQELDARKREVVPSHTQKIVEAVIPISVDWQGGKLTLQLNRAPDRGWINTFTSPSRQHSWTQGIAPHNFNFMGSAVGIGVNEDFAQTAIESFKKFSQMATESYQLKLQEDAARLEAEQRLQLRRDIEEREKRQRVIANLRL